MTRAERMTCAELKPQQAGIACIYGTALIPDPKLKSAILHGIVQ